jgi:hypothetical protein
MLHVGGLPVPGLLRVPFFLYPVALEQCKPGSSSSLHSLEGAFCYSHPDLGHAPLLQLLCVCRF